MTPSLSEQSLSEFDLKCIDLCHALYYKYRCFVGD